MRLAAALICLLLVHGPTAAQAQSADVPDELIREGRRQTGDMLTVCNDASSPIRDYDRAVATAIGEALFLKVRFDEGLTGFPITGDGYLQELRIAMATRCDLMMGMAVQDDSPFPDWSQMTRPYAAFGYVLAVADPSWHALADIPTDRVIGTQLGSIGEWGFITWNELRPAATKYRRLPYADSALMARRVLDGHLGGMLIWQPVLAGLQATDPQARGLRVIDTAPLPAAVTRVGGLVSSKDSYLRSQIDAAIDALGADGTLARIAADHGYAALTP